LTPRWIANVASTTNIARTTNCPSRKKRLARAVVSMPRRFTSVLSITKNAIHAGCGTIGNTLCIALAPTTYSRVGTNR